MAWYDTAVFYHIYPLGLCGCAHENTGEEPSKFGKLTKWAEHVKKLGCNAIYIGPLFESGTHGYDTIDYRKVDRRIGTNGEFRTWVDHCHELGMKVIVDGVFNHVGRDFFAFSDLKEKRVGSSYRDWFCNVNFYGNNEYNDGFSYDNWGGHNLLVKLNQRHPQVKDYHFETIRFWVREFDIDGIRLDAADVLDFDFMRDLRNVANDIKPDFWLMGEVIHGDYSRWANPQMLHSVTNYDLHKGLFSGHNDHNYFEIAHTIKRLNDICRGTKLYTFVDNHDVARIYEKVNNKEHLYPVTLLLYTVYGIPSVYYGSEFSIPGPKEKHSDWNLRPCLELSDYEDYYENNEITKLHCLLGRAKQQFAELKDGRYEELLLTNRQFAFGRVLENSAMVMAVNNDDNPAHVEVRLPVQANYAVSILDAEIDWEANGSESLDLSGCKKMQIQDNRLVLDIPGNRGYVVWVSSDQEKLVSFKAKAKKKADDVIPTLQKEEISNEPIAVPQEEILDIIKEVSAEAEATSEKQVSQKEEVSAKLSEAISKELLRKKSSCRVLGAPNFVFEIVDVGNPADAYVEKLYQYKNDGVREYWIVDPQRRIVTVNYFEKNIINVQYSYYSIIKVNSCEDLWIDFGDIWKQLEG